MDWMTGISFRPGLVGEYIKTTGAVLGGRDGCASAVPSSVNGDTYSTQQWPELFAGTPGITFCDTSGNCGTPAPGTTSGGPEALGTSNWGWTYRAGFGSDSSCPNVGSQWVDAYPSAGSAPADGNILAPDAGHC
jgi:hypothetical protein